MSLADVLPQVRSLSPRDKVQLLHHIAEDLATEEPAALLRDGASYPVWSPDHAFEGAAVLLEELKKAEAKS